MAESLDSIINKSDFDCERKFTAKYLYGHGHGSLMYGYRAFCQQKKKNLPKRFYFVCYKIIKI